MDLGAYKGDLIPVRIGVDLGGTKIEGIALGPDGTARFRRRVDTPRGDYDATVQAIADLVQAIEAATGHLGTVGIGMPGIISPATGLVKNANSTWLNGRPLQEDLRRVLRRDVRLANDANCFALSEASDGAAAGAGVVFGVILGTGTGGGVVVGGRVLAGANAIAGEWGHNALPWPDADEWPGPPCYCGRRGCIETFVSGPGMQSDHEARTGSKVPAPDIVAAAASGDRAAEETLQRYEDRLARALAAIVNILDPDVIVLGGGMSNIARLYTHVPRLWESYVFACGGTSREPVRTRLVPAMHGDSSGVRGAAWLWDGS